MRLTTILSIGSLLVTSVVSKPLTPSNGNSYLSADYCTHPVQGEGCNEYTQNPCCTAANQLAKCLFNWKKATYTWDIKDCKTHDDCKDNTCYRESVFYSHCLCDGGA
jgi:hypothetical protein